MLAEVDARGAALDAGARSTAAWLTAKARVPYGEAKRTTRFAVGLRDHAPRVAEGLAEGGITPAHAEVIADVLRHLASRTVDGSPVFDATDLGTAEETLLELAGSLDPTSLRRAGQHLVTVMTADRIADQAPEADAVVLAEFTISRLSGFGWWGHVPGQRGRRGPRGHRSRPLTPVRAQPGDRGGAGHPDRGAAPRGSPDRGPVPPPRHR